MIRCIDAFKLPLTQALLLFNSSIRSGKCVLANSTTHPKQFGTLLQISLSPHTKAKGKFNRNNLFPQFLCILSYLLKSRGPRGGLIFRVFLTYRLRPTTHLKQFRPLPQIPLSPHTRAKIFKGKFHLNNLLPQFLCILRYLLQSHRPLGGLQCYMILRVLSSYRLLPFHCRRSRPLASLHHSTYPAHLSQHIPHPIWQDVFRFRVCVHSFFFHTRPSLLCLEVKLTSPEDNSSDLGKSHIPQAVASMSSLPNSSLPSTSSNSSLMLPPPLPSSLPASSPPATIHQDLLGSLKQNTQLYNLPAAELENLVCHVIREEGFTKLVSALS